MVVHVAQLLDSFRKTLWRNGVTKPERLTHRVDERGDHHIELEIKADEAVFDPPKRREGPSFFPWGVVIPPKDSKK